jgi:hypothetical protein
VRCHSHTLSLWLWTLRLLPSCVLWQLARGALRDFPCSFFSPGSVCTFICGVVEQMGFPPHHESMHLVFAVDTWPVGWGVLFSNAQDVPGSMAADVPNSVVRVLPLVFCEMFLSCSHRFPKKLL